MACRAALPQSEEREPGLGKDRPRESIRRLRDHRRCGVWHHLPKNHPQPRALLALAAVTSSASCRSIVWHEALGRSRGDRGDQQGHEEPRERLKSLKPEDQGGLRPFATQPGEQTAQRAQERRDHQKQSADPPRVCSASLWTQRASRHRSHIRGPSAASPGADSWRAPRS